MPILNNFLLEAKDGKFSVSASDLDTSIRLSIEAVATQDGSVLVPAKRFASIVRELPRARIEISVNERYIMAVSAGSSSFKIMGGAAEDFPPLPAAGDKMFFMPQALMLTMLKMTAFAMSEDHSRYILNGVLVALEPGSLTMVATDGRRLAVITHDMPEVKKKEEAIIPTRAVNELLKHLRKDALVTVSVSGSTMAFELPNGTLTTKLIEGSFPNYAAVIPSKANVEVLLPRQEMMAAVHRVALMSSEKSNSVKLEIAPGEVRITANSIEVGEARHTIALPDYRGEAVAISFNPAFLLAPLRELTQQNVYLDLIDGISPGVVRPAGDDADATSKSKTVIMPLKCI